MVVAILVRWSLSSTTNNLIVRWLMVGLSFAFGPRNTEDLYSRDRRGNKYILSLISQMISQLSFVTFKTHYISQTTNNKEDDDNNNNNNNNNKTTTINQK